MSSVEVEGLLLPAVWVLESATAPLWLGRGASGGLTWWPWGPELLRFASKAAAGAELARLRASGELPAALEVLVVGRVDVLPARDTEPTPTPRLDPVEQAPIDVPRCRGCGAQLGRLVGSAGPWTCVDLLLGSTAPGVVHDELDAPNTCPPSSKGL